MTEERVRPWAARALGAAEGLTAAREDAEVERVMAPVAAAVESPRAAAWMRAWRAGVSLRKKAATGLGKGPRATSSSRRGGSLMRAKTGLRRRSSIVTSGAPVMRPTTPDGKMRRSVSSTKTGVLAPMTLSAPHSPVAISWRTRPKQTTSQCAGSSFGLASTRAWYGAQPVTATS